MATAKSPAPSPRREPSTSRACRRRHRRRRQRLQGPSVAATQLGGRQLATSDRRKTPCPESAARRLPSGRRRAGASRPAGGRPGARRDVPADPVRLPALRAGRALDGADDQARVAGLRRDRPDAAAQGGDVITYVPPVTRSRSTHRIIRSAASPTAARSTAPRATTTPPRPLPVHPRRAAQARVAFAIPYLGYSSSCSRCRRRGSS